MCVSRVSIYPIVLLILEYGEAVCFLSPHASYMTHSSRIDHTRHSKLSTITKVRGGFKVCVFWRDRWWFDSLNWNIFKLYFLSVKPSHTACNLVDPWLGPATYVRIQIKRASFNGNIANVYISICCMVFPTVPQRMFVASFKFQNFCRLLMKTL
jgi:hypothetical protein